MSTSASRPPAKFTGSDALIIFGIATIVAASVGLWIGGQAASLCTGNGLASGAPMAGVNAVISYRDDPGLAWESPMPEASVYWSVCVGSVLLLVCRAVERFSN